MKLVSQTDTQLVLRYRPWGAWITAFDASVLFLEIIGFLSMYSRSLGYATGFAVFFIFVIASLILLSHTVTCTLDRNSNSLILLERSTFHQRLRCRYFRHEIAKLLIEHSRPWYCLSPRHGSHKLYLMLRSGKKVPLWEATASKVQENAWQISHFFNLPPYIEIDRV